MIRAIMNGCHGVMGHVITDIVSKDDAIEIVAGVDMNTESYAGYPVFQSLSECPEADVIIDFSTAKAVDGLLNYCEEKKVPVVLCTTGLSEDQLNHVKEASKVDAVLRSANMSIGINLLMKTLKEVAPVLAAAGFDIEILEKHHNRKIDAPSGTAIALADAINESLDNSYHYKYDRSSERIARDPKEIGFSAVRGGKQNAAGRSRCKNGGCHCNAEQSRHSTERFCRRRCGCGKGKGSPDDPRRVGR